MKASPSIKTDAEIKKLLPWAKVAEAAPTILWTVFLCILLLSYYLMIRGVAPYSIVIAADVAFSALMAFLSVVSRNALKKLSGYEPVGPSSMLYLAEQAAPYPDIQEQLQAYLQVRDYLTVNEYAEMITDVRARTEAQTGQQLGTVRSSLSHHT